MATLAEFRQNLKELQAELATRRRPTRSNDDYPGFTSWLHTHLPEMTWTWGHLKTIRKELVEVTRGRVDRIWFALPPQHGKTRGVTVPYPAWRMLREPGLRCGVGAHTQRYAEKISRWVRKLVVRAGGEFGAVSRVDEWELTNGSTFIARGVGASIAGEPLDLFVMDDVFGGRQDADSPAAQEAVHEWYMDDVTPRLQKTAAIIGVNTRWGPGDLFGRILASEEGPEWRYVRIPAIAETQEERDEIARREGRPTGEPDPLDRQPGAPLCEDRFPLAKLEQKRRIEGVGFESQYQGNPIPRGGSFFDRGWFGEPLAAAPDGLVLHRYWDLASSRKDSACFTSGILMGRKPDGELTRFVVADVVRGRWSAAERNEVMRQTAVADAARPGFVRTYFEAPVFDRERAAERAIVAALAGFPVRADRVNGQGNKELRAEPLAAAAKAGLVRLVAGSWNAAFLTELEGFPKAQYKDQVDSASGCYNSLAKPEVKVEVVTW